MRAWARVLAVGCCAALTLGGSAAAQGRAASLKLQDLPPAVQKTVRENLEGATIRHIGRETEDGVEQYEIETRLDGRSRDFNVDTDGRLLVVEEATTLEAIPAAARAGILKIVADGKLTSVETFTETGHPAMYEAGYTDKTGRRHEVLVKADGTRAKN